MIKHSTDGLLFLKAEKYELPLTALAGHTPKSKLKAWVCFQ
jgi:hypothetical protein